MNSEIKKTNRIEFEKKCSEEVLEITFSLFRNEKKYDVLLKQGSLCFSPGTNVHFLTTHFY